MNRPASLRLRLTTLVTLLTGGAICLFALIFYLILQANLLREIDVRLQDRAQLVREELIAAEAPGAATRLPDLPPLVEFSAPGIYVELRGPSGDLLAASPNLGADRLPEVLPLLADAQGGIQVIETVQAGDNEDLRLLVTRAPAAIAPQALLLVAESLEPVESTLAQARTLLLICGIGALLLAAGSAAILTGVALAPMARLTRTAALIAATGNYHERLPAPTRSDEVGQLAVTINDLVTTVEHTLEQQRQLLADTSHELRSPLTVVLANLDLLRRDLEPWERELCVDEASDEAQRMRRLVNDLLLLAQADATQVIARAPVPLDTLVSEMTATIARQAPTHCFVPVITPGLVVQGDRERLMQALRNLLENAVRYTPPDTRVTVQLQTLPDGMAEITVTDTGPGIAAEHLPYLWDRFYRVEKTRSRTTGGIGLGLAIVKYIIEAHGGGVAVASTTGAGTAFSVQLPLMLPQERFPSPR
jgi:two-component system, OmpR family, sensor kinase